MGGAVAPVREGHADFRSWQTWYRVTGSLGGDKLPLVVLHGGPGCTHDYVDSLKGLAKTGRAIIHYDQLGNGRSTHLRDKGTDFWTPRLFLDELENLTRHLGIDSAYDVLGQSWGGMLGAEHAVTQPRGLRALVISDSPASMELWVQEANRLRADLPPDVQATLLRHEAAGTTSTDEYNAAVRVFYDKHVCRVNPWPPEVQRTFDAMGTNPTVYMTMNGPSEFHVIGTLKSWSIIDRLKRIEVPVLLISGKYDEATPATVQPFKDKIKDVRWEIFEHSSHMPHVEETERYLKVVGQFLDAHDRKR
jgi:L-proline amide hydrolase